MTFEEFCNFIKSLDENMSIGIHGVKEETLLNEPDIAEKILSKGLTLDGWGGILSTVKMYGRVKDLDDRKLRKIYQYAWGIGKDGKIVNFLFGFPEIITNSDKEEFYLGHYEEDSYGKDETKAGSNLPLNVLYDDKRHIPNQFIIGCIISPLNTGTIDLYKNPYFYGRSDDAQIFFDELYRDLCEAGIPNPIDMIEYEAVYAQYKLPLLSIEQYKQYLNEKGTQY